jgi:PD-(D/E)XK nuclease superfamily
MTGDAGCEDREIGVSWSRLREHAECHMKASLKADGKRSKVSDIRVFFPGTVADRVMRRWLTQVLHERGEMAAMVDEVMDAEEALARESGDGIVRWRGPSDRAEVRAFCLELAEKLEPILAEHVLPYEWEPAWRFRIPLVVQYLDGSPQRVWLVGELDLLVNAGAAGSAGTFRYVWDLKATRDDSYWRKNVGQLLFYALAVRLDRGAWPDGCGLIQPMCRNPVLQFAFTDADYRKLLSAVSSYCLDVWSKDRQMTDDLHVCSRCDVPHACPRYAVPGGRGRTSW